MKLTISTNDGNIYSMDIPESLTLGNFKAYLQEETGIESGRQILTLDGHPIDDDSKELAELGVKDNDLLQLLELSATGHSQMTTTNDVIEAKRQELLNNPQMRNQINLLNPQLGAALNDPERFRQLMSNMNALVNKQPKNEGNQQSMLELLRQEEIDRSLQMAMEDTPEAFVHVNMLYLNIRLNGHDVQAFVDTGAQRSLISSALAKKVGLADLIDTRFKSEARGVGKGIVSGVIHSASIQFDDSGVEIPCSLSVLDAGLDFLLGLDLLRRYQCKIDLEKNCLIVAGSIEAKFLHETEVKSPIEGGIFNQPTPSSSNADSQSSRAAIERQGGTQAQSYNPTESDITILVGLGFSRSEAIKALKSTNGNVDMAASLLFQ